MLRSKILGDGVSSLLLYHIQPSLFWSGYQLYSCVMPNVRWTVVKIPLHSSFILRTSYTLSAFGNLGQKNGIKSVIIKEDV
jgi:hypothetical protein